MTQAYRTTVQRRLKSRMSAQLIIALPVLSALGIASAMGQEGYSFEEQEACTSDAFRLCSEFIPDIPRITACMQAKRDQLSPRCAKMFEPGRDRHLKEPDQRPSNEPRPQPNVTPLPPSQEQHDQEMQ